ncbi:FecR family protein [Lewinella sp. IMCC34191]|uniref:FecR family protein n=1 Tax=Lewinella sp. IMCC34191 TaxID=2259172 RepID=UPI000E243DC4|nr:FecR domain-containing protein [Lewinella sp. IMCC34191]
MLSAREEELLKRLHTGECTEEELDQVFAMVSQLPESRAHRVLESLWQYSNYRQRMPPAAYDAILARMDTAPSRKGLFTSKQKSYAPWLAAAAVLLLLVAGGIAFLNGTNELITTTTGFAEQKSVRLPDGSVVRLNANSRLSYAPDWDEVEDRIVNLRGEAYFKVRPNPATGQKFLVATPDLTVAVLGTVFNVNSREEETSVYLEEGAIALQLVAGERTEKTMAPGELVTYSARQKQLVAGEKPAKPEVHTSWKDGVLVFENTPLRKVLDKIENIYGVTLEVADTSIYGRKITAGLPMEEISIVMPLLEQVLGYPIEGEAGRYRIEE